MSEPKPLSFLGRLGRTGSPLLPPLTQAELGKIALRSPIDPGLLEEVRKFLSALTPDDPHRDPGLQFREPRDLAETGWGVVFAKDTPAKVRRALGPLLELRKEQAGPRYREIEPEELSRRPGLVDPDRFPYYVLLVGQPEELSFETAAELDIQYAVGRLCFTKPDDLDAHDVEAYDRYVQNLESLESRPSRQTVALFGPRESGDDATEQLCDELMKPLAGRLNATLPGWKVQPAIAEAATHHALRQILSVEIPSLLFTACHGVGFPCGDKDQLAEQGALCCQPEPDGPDCFTAADLVAGVDLRGLISVHLTCFGLGTPANDSFAMHALGGGEQIADRPFLARLPQDLLKAGARAVVGHVDRAWTSSLYWPDKGDAPALWLALLKHLGQGLPVGHALQLFGRGAADLSFQLGRLWNHRNQMKDIDPEVFARLWCASEDAAGFQVLGDPAVRLNFD